jgi:hypothetical protein
LLLKINEEELQPEIRIELLRNTCFLSVELGYDSLRLLDPPPRTGQSPRRAEYERSADSGEAGTNQADEAEHEHDAEAHEAEGERPTIRGVNLTGPTDSREEPQRKTDEHGAEDRRGRAPPCLRG